MHGEMTQGVKKLKNHWSTRNQTDK